MAVVCAEETLDEGAGTPSSLSVVIPALNEENGIDAILQRVLAQRVPLAEVGIRDLEVIVVDDGSKDRTEDRISLRFKPRMRRTRASGAIWWRGVGYGKLSCHAVTRVDSHDPAISRRPVR